MTMTSAGLTDVPVTDDQLVAVITDQLPRLLETRPAVRRNLYRTLVKFLAEEGLLDRFVLKMEKIGRAEGWLREPDTPDRPPGEPVGYPKGGDG